MSALTGEGALFAQCSRTEWTFISRVTNCFSRKKRCGRLDPRSEFFDEDGDPFGSILGSDDDEEASDRMALICGDSG